MTKKPKCQLSILKSFQEVSLSLKTKCKKKIKTDKANDIDMLCLYVCEYDCGRFKQKGHIRPCFYQHNLKIYHFENEKNVNPEGEDATDQASSVKGFVHMSISSVLIVFTELGLTQMLEISSKGKELSFRSFL